MIEDYREALIAAARAIHIEISDNVALPGEHFLEVNGIGVHYLDWGGETLPPVVLLHGGGLTAHTWDMAAVLLRDRYRLIAPDARGHGDTQWTPDPEHDD